MQAAASLALAVGIWIHRESSLLNRFTQKRIVHRLVRFASKWRSEYLLNELLTSHGMNTIKKGNCDFFFNLTVQSFSPQNSELISHNIFCATNFNTFLIKLIRLRLFMIIAHLTIQTFLFTIVSIYI